MKRFSSKLLLASSAAGLLLCSGQIARAATIDDEARYLAGLSSGADSLSSLESTKFWKDHAKEFDSLWDRAAAGRHKRMRDWALSELLPRIPKTSTLYYPFGGPDFLTAQIFFPTTPTVILAGLEPVGTVPDIASLPQDTLAASLQNLRKTMYPVLMLGFFETKDMRTDLKRTPVEGVKPILYVSLVRTGHRIIQESYFTLGRDGSIAYTRSPSSGTPSGLKLTFEKRSGGPQRELYYISGNLANGGDSGILRFFARNSPGGTYLKAASYLMHEGEFSTVRNFLLDESRFILQDDSGIPVRNFDRSKWTLFFFGNYLGTMRAFNKYFQPDLRDIYARPDTTLPMPFGIGYRTSDTQAGQMLAVRGGSGKSEAPVQKAVRVKK